MRVLVPICLALMLNGCLARTAYDVVTLPVRATSQVVDWPTTSRDEADRNSGRKIRKQRERDAKAARRQAKRDRETIRQQGSSQPY